MDTLVRDDDGNIIAETAEPSFVEPSTAPAPKENEDHTADGPVFMSDDWDDETPPVLPELLEVEGNWPLMYEGESHLVYGENGSGKSWFSLLAALRVARAGGVVVYLDYESNRRTIKERLKALGPTREEAGRIAYWRLNGPLNGPLWKVLWNWMDFFPPKLVILDSLSKGMSAMGKNESDNSDYIWWDQRVVVPFVLKRITVLLIDHVGHQSEHFGGSRPIKARGASSKADQVSGATYSFETQEHWTRESSGWARLVCWKDREGYRKKGQPAADLHVTVANMGANVSMVLKAPAAAASGKGALEVKNILGKEYPRLSWFMERVSEELEEADGPLSQTQLETRIKKNAANVRAGAAWLYEEGFATFEQKGQSKLFTHVKRYKQTEDKKTDKYEGSSEETPPEDFIDTKVTTDRFAGLDEEFSS